MQYLQRRLRPTKRLHRKYQKQARRILTKLQTGGWQGGQVFAYLRKINPYVFEEVLLIAFREQGFRVEKRRKYSHDGGIDGVIYCDKGRKYLVQAKRYSSTINPTHVKHFIHVVDSHAHGGFFVHTGRAGGKSKQDLPRNIKIISGERLLTLLDIDTQASIKMKAA